jgi:hypothetical protein
MLQLGQALAQQLVHVDPRQPIENPGSANELLAITGGHRQRPPIVKRHNLSRQSELNLRSPLDDGSGQLPRLRFDKPLRHSWLRAEQSRGFLILLTQQTMG